MEAMIKISEAHVETGNAGSYLRKLCQHWSHKFLVSYEAEHGTIDLAAAKCILDADETALKVRLEMPPDGDQARMQKVVEDHLKRFASRETLVFDWNSAAA